jgi:hypothetical protein
VSTEVFAHLVANYAPASDGPEAVLQYPYKRPSESFITDGKEVTLVPATDHNEFVKTVDDYLGYRGLPLLDERVPVVGYGSNVSPYQLHKKMSGYGQGDNLLTQVVPNEYVVVPDSVVAWHGKPGQNGSTFAELYKGDETRGKATPAVVQYFTVEQLAIMHTSEGETYCFVPLEVTPRDGTKIRAFAYVAGKSHVLRVGGAPLEVACNGETGPGRATAEQAVQHMLDVGGGAIDAITALALVQKNAEKGTKLAKKKARQEAVRQALEAAGMSIEFSYPGSDKYIGRADFGTPQSGGHTPRILHLAEEHVAGIRPTAAQIAERAAELRADDPDMTEATALSKARDKIDAMTGIRKRATTELARRLGADVLEAGAWGADGTRQQDGVVWKKVQTGPNAYRIEQIDNRQSKVDRDDTRRS